MKRLDDLESKHENYLKERYGIDIAKYKEMSLTDSDKFYDIYDDLCSKDDGTDLVATDIIDATVGTWEENGILED